MKYIVSSLQGEVTMLKRMMSLLLTAGMLFCMGSTHVAAAEASQAAGSEALMRSSVSTKTEQSAFRVYLSPSPQYYNLYPDGKTEEDYMRQIANWMAQYLHEYGIETIIAPSSAQVPASEWGTMLQERAKQAVQNNCTLYLSIHSNAAPEALSGQYNGCFIYYQTDHPMSGLWAQIVKNNFIYPEADKIKLANNQTLTEMAYPEMPALLVQTAFHDYPRDADWIMHNTQRIAANLSYSIAQYRKEYYGVPIQEITNPNLQIPFL